MTYLRCINCKRTASDETVLMQLAQCNCNGAKHMCYDCYCSGGSATVCSKCGVERKKIGPYKKLLAQFVGFAAILWGFGFVTGVTLAKCAL